MVGPSPLNLLDVQNRLQITLRKKSKIKVSKMETKTEEDSVIRLKNHSTSHGRIGSNLAHGIPKYAQSNVCPSHSDQKESEWWPS